MQVETAMLTIGLNRNRSEWAALRFEIAFRRLMLALKDGFNCDQPRDEQGRWTSEGALAANTTSRETECEAQYSRDTFICNALRLRSCWERAAERYAACLRGRSIPKLRF